MGSLGLMSVNLNLKKKKRFSSDQRMEEILKEGCF